MEWYWWMLIGIGVIVIGVIKVKVGGKYLAKKKKEAEERAEMRNRED